MCPPHRFKIHIPLDGGMQHYWLRHRPKRRVYVLWGEEGCLTCSCDSLAVIVAGNLYETTIFVCVVVYGKLLIESGTSTVKAYLTPMASYYKRGSTAKTPIFVALTSFGCVASNTVFTLHTWTVFFLQCFAQSAGNGCWRCHKTVVNQLIIIRHGQDVLC